MLAKRIIPCLDVDQGRVVKGTRFVDIRDAGDPVEQARFYDKSGADELVFLDITATHEARGIMEDVVRRTAVNPREVRRLREAVRNAFRVQMAGLGYSLVEVVSNCPTNWGLTPLESLEFVEEKVLPYYPLGDYRVKPEVQALLTGVAVIEREPALVSQSWGEGGGNKA